MYKMTYIHNPLVSENTFRTAVASDVVLPTYVVSQNNLPQPFWQNHEVEISCYWKAWEIAFRNLKQPSKQNGFISNYIDTAYNDNIFMWDSCFMTMFGIYGRNAFNFLGTLDNFYAKQHPDGYICREISQINGNDLFHRYDPVSTGPNLFVWAEWNNYLHSGNKERLEKIFPVLVAYHKWLMANRTWKDGSYWASGWGTGMDNLPRLPIGCNQNFSHGHMTWLDSCLQQILSGKLLFKIGEIIERWQEIEEIIDEVEDLTQFVNKKMWDSNSNFYFDLYRDDRLNSCMNIGAYWALIADIVPKEKIDAFIQHLDNENEFKRPHMIPSLVASNMKYNAKGRYWVGGVWSPTNYMVLKGLDMINQYDLNHSIARNHIFNLSQVYSETGTLWENYAPEVIAPATPSKPNFVGWTGVSAINILLEDVFGLKPVVGERLLIWNIRLLEEFGVENYPFGSNGLISLSVLSRSSENERPQITINSNVDFTLCVIYGGCKEIIEVKQETSILES